MVNLNRIECQFGRGANLWPNDSQCAPQIRSLTGRRLTGAQFVPVGRARQECEDQTFERRQCIWPGLAATTKLEFGRPAACFRAPNLASGRRQSRGPKSGRRSL